MGGRVVLVLWRRITYWYSGTQSGAIAAAVYGPIKISHITVAFVQNNMRRRGEQRHEHELWVLKIKHSAVKYSNIF